MAESLKLPPALANRGIALRPTTALDAPFLRALYATARIDATHLELLPAEQREPFLDDQFRLQSQHYRTHFGDADFLVIEQHGKLAGRLILDRSTAVWTVVDIALLPALRGQGVGRNLMQAIQDSARSARAEGIRLQVEVNNRARDLYRALGFAETGESGIRVAMIWTVS